MLARMFTAGKNPADFLEALKVFEIRDGGRPKVIETGPGTEIPPIAEDIPRRVNPKAPKGYWYFVLED